MKISVSRVLADVPLGNSSSYCASHPSESAGGGGGWGGGASGVA